VPSQSSERISARLAVVSLFILNIMLAYRWSVKWEFQFKQAFEITETTVLTVLMVQVWNYQRVRAKWPLIVWWRAR